MALVAVAGVAAGAPHRSYRGQKVSAGATHANRGQIGNAIFTLEETAPDQKVYPATLEKLEFKAGAPPKLFARRFFPCTLKEAAEAVKKKEPTAANFRLQTWSRLLKGADVLEASIANSPVAGKLLEPSWNTARADLHETLGPALGNLLPGEYELAVDSHLTWDVPRDGGATAAKLQLAGGRLKLLVKP